MDATGNAWGHRSPSMAELYAEADRKVAAAATAWLCYL